MLDSCYRCCIALKRKIIAIDELRKWCKAVILKYFLERFFCLLSMQFSSDSKTMKVDYIVQVIKCMTVFAVDWYLSWLINGRSVINQPSEVLLICFERGRFTAFFSSSRHSVLIHDFIWHTGFITRSQQIYRIGHWNRCCSTIFLFAIRWNWIVSFTFLPLFTWRRSELLIC
jgi:hypothetical protein